jgi:hypothetical protein
MPLWACTQQRTAIAFEIRSFSFLGMIQVPGKGRRRGLGTGTSEMGDALKCLEEQIRGNQSKESPPRQ